MVSTDIVYVIIFFVTYSSATVAQSDNKTERNNKYCDIQQQVCNNIVHPLCPQFNPVHLRTTNYHFYDLSQDDKDFILKTINTFRNELAAGKIAGHPQSGSNLRVVNWSDDYVELLKAKLLYKTVCIEVSLTGGIILEREEFSDPSGNYNSHLEIFTNRVANDSTSNSPWIDIFRAEFDQIGCAYYEDDYAAFRFACYINRYGPRDANNDKLYNYGAPCSHCGDRCSDRWTNLCDDIVEEPRTDSSPTNIINYLIIFGSCVLLIVSGIFATFWLTRKSGDKKFNYEWVPNPVPKIVIDNNI